MELLRNLLGNLSSGVIRLIVAVGILAAVGIFVVRPVLDTTEKVAHEGFERSRQINREVNRSIQNSTRGLNGPGGSLTTINRTLKEVNKQVQAQIRQSVHVAKVHGAGSPKRLLKCIERADADVHKITRCTAKF